VEGVGETVRAFLNIVAGVAPEWFKEKW
jgi:hypothetical protein